MTIYQKAKAVDRLFGQLDGELKKFSATTKLHCLVGCGRCCSKPDIDATILELLPLALNYYISGKAEEMLHLLKNSDSTCHVYTVTNGEMGAGFCSDYAHRALVCRLFGFSARRAKNDQLQLYTCSSIKNTQPEEFAKTTATINQAGKVPVVSDYYQKLTNIDPDLTRSFYPINVATVKALELVMHYYAYRRPPRHFRKTA